MGWQRFEITVPKSTYWSPEKAATFLHTLQQFLPPETSLELQIVVSGGTLHWSVVFDPETLNLSPQALQQAVTAYYPGGDVREATYFDVPYPHYCRSLVLRRNIVEDFEDFGSILGHKAHDPFLMLAQTMSQVQADEILTYSVLLLSTSKIPNEKIMDVLTMSAFDAGYRAEGLKMGGSTFTKSYNFTYWLTNSIFENKRLKNERVWKYEEKDTQRYMAKLSQPLSNSIVMLSIETPRKERLQLLTPIASAIKTIGAEGISQLNDGMDKEGRCTDSESYSQLKPLHLLSEWDKAAMKRTKGKGDNSHFFLLSAQEIATLWHLPHADFSSLNVAWVSPVPPQVISNGWLSPDRVRIGTADGANTYIAISRPDTRYHRYITGQTGMGKSTLLHHLITEDIYSGCGVAVLDPHGTLIRDILACSIPPERAGDVIHLELGNSRRPVPLNPFRTPSGVDEQQRFDTVFWIFKSLYAGSWSETRMETTIRNILQVLSADPEATPLDFQEIILNDTYRRKIVERAVQQGSLSFASRNWWSNFNNLSPSERQSQTQSVLSRLNAFLGSAQVEKMTCHPGLLDFRQFITQKKIVLVNLKGDAINSEVGSLGAILLAQFYLASLGLGDIPGDAPPRYYLYVDEAQRFITTSLPAMFSEARKFGLALTLSNQYLGQLDDETREGILKNVGTKVSFECHPDEARLTGKMYEPDIETAILTSLGRGRAVVKTRSGGETLKAFVVKVTPPLQPSVQPQMPTTLQFPTAQEVTDWLTQRYEGDLFKKPPAEDKLTDFEPPVDAGDTKPRKPISDPTSNEDSASLSDFEPPIDTGDTKPRKPISDPTANSDTNSLSDFEPPIDEQDTRH